MDTTNNKITFEESGRVYPRMYLRYQDIKSCLLLYLFIALEWIISPFKKKERGSITEIGLS
ncbi:MAG: hypothetical protein ACLFQA_06790 [Bacteroidales bacterium]